MILKTVVFASLVALAFGHGRLISPPGRSTMWRYGYKTPPNYNDNQMYCGGFYTQWTINGGKCGVCGDPWNGAHVNEAGGKYATGIIVGKYTSGQKISVKVQVTASHRGYFEFRLCPVNSPHQHATHACLDRHLLRRPNGQTKFNEPGSSGTYTVDLLLPQGLVCKQCVLQWKWNTGNSYNCDDNQNCCVGCGPQEQFYGCADISITSSGGGVASSHYYHPSQQQGGFIPINQGTSSGGGVSSSHDKHPVLQQGGVIGFIPINSGTGQSATVCKATPMFKARYPYADRYCTIQCSQGRCLSSQYCTDACRSK